MSPSERASETSPLLASAGGGKRSWSQRVQRIRRSQTFSLFVVTLCTLVDNLIYGIVVPLFPLTLQHYAHVPEENLQFWIWMALASFGVAQIVCSALAAIAVLRYASAITVMFAALVGLAGAIILYIFATHPLLVVLARVAQGASNAVVNVVGLVVLVEKYGSNNYGKSFGYIGTATAIGCVAGPVLSGVIYKLLGYYAVFFVTAALVIFCALLTLAIDSTAAEEVSVHDSAQSSSTVPQHVGENGNDGLPQVEHGQDTTSRGTGSKTRFGLRTILSLWGLSLSALLPCSLDTIMPLHLTKLFGWNPLQIGLVFLALVPGALFGPYIGDLGDRIGAKIPLVFSALVAAGTMAAISQVLHDSVADKVLLFVSALFGGMAEPAFFSLCGSVIADVVGKLLSPEALNNPKSQVVWSSVVVNYAASTGGLLGTVAVGNAQDLYGWTVAAAIPAGILAVSGLLFGLFL